MNGPMLLLRRGGLDGWGMEEEGNRIMPINLATPLTFGLLEFNLNHSRQTFAISAREQLSCRRPSNTVRAEWRVITTTTGP